MNSTRDEFRKSTILMLALRVGYKCSFPNCGTATVGPAQDETKAVNNGVASHICAAAEGGPRYDYKMTPEERRSLSNGVWLCATHASLIDKDPTRYPVELLHKWKNAAEEKARKDLIGQKLANRVEIIEEDKRIIQMFILTLEDEDTISLLNHDFHGKYPRKWYKPFYELSDFYHLFSRKPGHKVLRVLTDQLMKSVDQLIWHLSTKGFTSKDWINDGTFCFEDEFDMLLCNCICLNISKEYENLIKTYKKILYEAETQLK